MFSSVLGSTLTLPSFLLCVAAAVVCGIIISLIYNASVHATSSLALTIAMLPAITTMVIMMVNGNLGVGVAVAGSFSLVRFRSLPGRATDIVVIFLAMGVGLCTGMGYVMFALLMSVLLSGTFAVLSMAPWMSGTSKRRSLRITIPEDLDYTSVFDEIFAKYTTRHEETSVKTANLGTMYQISYDIMLRDPKEEKKMIDELRVRNGNLPVISGTSVSQTDSM